MVIASGSDNNVSLRHSPQHFPEGNLVRCTGMIVAYQHIRGTVNCIGRVYIQSGSNQQFRTSTSTECATCQVAHFFHFFSIFSSPSGIWFLCTLYFSFYLLPNILFHSYLLVFSFLFAHACPPPPPSASSVRLLHVVVTVQVPRHIRERSKTAVRHVQRASPGLQRQRTVHRDLVQNVEF